MRNELIILLTAAIQELAIQWAGGAGAGQLFSQFCSALSLRFELMPTGKDRGVEQSLAKAANIQASR
ncbi:MAG TPA: hypothetical protein IGR89_15180 [Oscillatoriaceae cyanobacterium M7585_C2015_266]|nr:hypothetical protein [Oscillatoriaceae cyanobacterium M7585_C2015_266]